MYWKKATLLTWRPRPSVCDLISAIKSSVGLSRNSVRDYFTECCQACLHLWISAQWHTSLKGINKFLAVLYTHLLIDQGWIRRRCKMMAFFMDKRGPLCSCATNRKVAGSIPAGVSGFSIDIKSFRSHYGPGVESASNRNEYQEHFLGVKAGGA